jgi:dihydropteroate synthase
MDAARSGPATLAAEIFAAWQGADYIRTHDVAAARDALAVLAAITREAGQAEPALGQLYLYQREDAAGGRFR